MIVLYWMTPDPIIVREDTPLLEVWDLSRQHEVRRFPVVRGDDELCGLIARTDLLRVLPAGSTGELSDETRAELARHKVADYLRREPVTCDAYDHIEDVSRRFCETKVGAMPVLNRGHLVGIISETDLMRALAELGYQGRGGRRITVRLPATSEPGQELLYSLVDLCRRYHLELLAVLTHPILDESKMVATLRVDGEHIDRFVQALWEEGFRVVELS